MICRLIPILRQRVWGLIAGTQGPQSVYFLRDDMLSAPWSELRQFLSNVLYPTRSTLYLTTYLQCLASHLLLVSVPPLLYSSLRE